MYARYTLQMFVPGGPQAQGRTLFSGGSFEVNADKRKGLGEKATNKQRQI